MERDPATVESFPERVYAGTATAHRAPLLRQIFGGTRLTGPWDYLEPVALTQGFFGQIIRTHLCGSTDARQRRHPRVRQRVVGTVGKVRALLFVMRLLSSTLSSGAGPGGGAGTIRYRRNGPVPIEQQPDPGAHASPTM